MFSFVDFLPPTCNSLSVFGFKCYCLLCILNEGLVVSICLAGAFIGSLLSGWIADGIGRRKAFQLCALPMIIGASIR